MSACPPPGDVIERERRGFFRNALAAGLGQAGSIVFGLGAMVITTRFLGADGYGALMVFFMVLGVINQVGLAWPNLALIRFGREEMREAGGIGATFRARATLYLACNAAVAAVVLAAREPLGRYLGLGPAGVWVLLAYAALLSGVEMFGYGFQAAGRFRAMAALGAGTKLLIFALLLGLYAGFARRGPAVTVLSLHLAALALLFVLGGGGLALAPELKGGQGTDSERARRMAGYAWPIMLGGLAGVVIGWVDTAVLKVFRPLHDVGTYGAAYQVVTVLDGLRAAVLSVLCPLIMSLAAEERRETLRWYLDEFLPTGAILAGGVLAIVGAACEAIPLIFGAAFAPSVWFSQVLVAGVAFTALQAMAVNVADAHNRVKQVIAVSVVVAVVNLAGDLALVPRLGPAGAAVSTAAAHGVGTFLVLAVVNGIREVRGPAPWRRYLAVLGLTPALALPAVAAAVGRPGLRMAAFAALLAGWGVLVRASGWFNGATLERLERIELPRPALRALRLLYGLLAAPARGGGGAA